MSARVDSDACVLAPYTFRDGGVDGLAEVVVYGVGYACPASPLSAPAVAAVQVTDDWPVRPPPQ